MADEVIQATAPEASPVTNTIVKSKATVVADQPTITTQVNDQVKSTFVPGMVRIINLTRSERDIILRGSSKHLHLLPYQRTWNAHISEPFPKKYLTDAIRGMKTRGEIDIMEVTE